MSAPSLGDEGLIEPARAGEMFLTLADLQVLATTAERNGTQHHFQEVALQWCGKAAAEVDRLHAELRKRHERQHEAEALAGHYLVQRDEARELLQHALDALEHHREQTRPIHRCDAVIASLRALLGAPTAHDPTS